MSQRRKRRIGLIHPRLALTIALLPICAGLMGTWGVLTANTIAGDSEVLFFGVLFAIPALTFYWGSVLIWAPTVRWTPDKRRMVVFYSGALVVGLLIAIAVCGDTEAPESFTLLCLVSGVGSGIAMALTHRSLWTAPRAPQPGPIPCPDCGANLRGQRDCRCHACGKLFTLGELAAARVVAVALDLPAEEESEENVADVEVDATANTEAYVDAKQ